MTTHVQPHSHTHDAFRTISVAMILYWETILASLASDLRDLRRSINSLITSFIKVSAIAEGPRDALSRWNPVSCYKTMQKIAFEKASVILKVTQGHRKRHCSIGRLYLPVSGLQ